MIGKVQKILSEIATRKLCTMDEHMAFYNDKAKEDYEFLSEIEEFIKALQEEPVSEELREAARKYFKSLKDDCFISSDIMIAFKAGAKWQEEQFEKNRLAACDRQTEEEAEIERDFIVGIIKKEHRQPTFDDAIKYGMRLQKEQMIQAKNMRQK